MTLKDGDGDQFLYSPTSSVVVMVYRNAAFGASDGRGGTSLTVTIPSLALLQANGSSWVGAMASTLTGMRDATAPDGMVPRTAGGGGGAGIGGFDTNGGVAAFPERTIPASSQPWNAFSFELMAIVSPASHAFGDQLVGTSSAAQSFTLTNPGLADVHGVPDAALTVRRLAPVSIPASSPSAPTPAARPPWPSATPAPWT